MKTTCYKYLFLLFLFPLVSHANNDFNGRYTKSKKINKSYKVSAKALLEIDNSYGKIEVQTWEKNQITIQVIVTTNGNDEEAVAKRLREIDVRFSNSPSKVSAKTILEKRDSSWWGKLFGMGNNVNIEINYTVKMPVTGNVDLNNDYGSIYLDKLKGNAEINCDYGSLFLGQLLGNNNQLNFDYTRGSHIAYIKNGSINADYSEFTIDEAGNLELNADYSEMEIEKVENINFSCDYGSLSLGKVRNIEGRADYLRTSIEALYRSADLNLDYGSFSLDNLMDGAQAVNIETDYTSIAIGYESTTPFSFAISMSYGSINGIKENGFYINKRHESNTDKYFEGYHLSPNQGAQIRIETKYGNIKFKD